LRIEKTIGIGAFLIILSLLAMPMGFATHPPHPKIDNPPGAIRGPLLKPGMSSIKQIYAASNPSGSCRSLGLDGLAVGYAELVHGNVMVFIQKGQPATFYNVTVVKLGNGESDKSWICGSSSQSVGSITTDTSGQGQLFQSFKASKGTSYVIELLDSQGHVLYASSVIIA